MFKNKKLLITGGTGSFGNAVLNNLILKNWFILVSTDEFSDKLT